MKTRPATLLFGLLIVLLTACSPSSDSNRDKTDNAQSTQGAQTKHENMDLEIVHSQQAENSKEQSTSPKSEAENQIDGNNPEIKMGAANNLPTAAVPKEEKSNSNVPVDDGFILLEDITGRKVELKVYNRTPDGYILATNRTGQNFSIPETKLSRASLRTIGEKFEKGAKLTVILKEISSKYSKGGNQFLREGEYSVGKKTAYSNFDVRITSTSPYNHNIIVDTYFTSLDGDTVYRKKRNAYTISKYEEVEFNMENSEATNGIKPVVIVLDYNENIISYNTNNSIIYKRLKEQQNK